MLQYDVKAISRKFFGHEVCLPEHSLNQPKARCVCIRSIHQSNRSISVRLLFPFCSRVFISRSYENRSIVKMVEYYDLNYVFSCNSLSDSIVNRYIGIMKNNYVSYWNQTLQQSQKLSFYCTIKDEYSPSPYLALTRKKPF